MARHLVPNRDPCVRQQSGSLDHAPEFNRHRPIHGQALLRCSLDQQFVDDVLVAIVPERANRMPANP